MRMLRTVGLLLLIVCCCYGCVNPEQNEEEGTETQNTSEQLVTVASGEGETSDENGDPQIPNEAEDGWTKFY